MTKKILKSFLNLFLFSAIIHNGVLICSTLKTGNIKFLNYFRILGLDEFWPKIANGRMSDLISGLVMVVIVLGFLGFSLRNKIKF